MENIHGWTQLQITWISTFSTVQFVLMCWRWTKPLVY